MGASKSSSIQRDPVRLGWRGRDEMLEALLQRSFDNLRSTRRGGVDGMHVVLVQRSARWSTLLICTAFCVGNSFEVHMLSRGTGLKNKLWANEGSVCLSKQFRLLQGGT